MTAPTPNAELAYAVLDVIDANPEQHEQNIWWREAPGCGTAGCFAGWAVYLSGGRMVQRDEHVSNVHVESGLGELNGKHVSVAAATLLGLKVHSPYEAENSYLFDEGNSRADLGRLVAEIFGPRPHPAESSFAPGSTLKDSPDPMYPEGEPDHSPDACLMLLGGERCPRCVGIFGASDLRCTVCGSLKSQHNQLGLQLHGLIPVEEMQPPPCADHTASELSCPVCTAQRRAFYAALGREIEVAEIVDHGPVKPPYGRPEREAYDREHGGAS